jgi:PIN domain nuclease of toxin-antitoxin system
LKLLLDSHALLWSLFEPNRLSDHARSLIGDTGNEVFISQASLWEVTIKIAKGKLAVPSSSIKPILAELRDLGFQRIPLKDEHLAVLESLPTFPDHKDPVDRLLVAQAIVEELPVLSVDAKIRRYPVKTIWR